MKVLVTGASGFVGRQLCEELCRQGYDVVAAVRSTDTHIENCKLIQVGSINSHTNWSIALENVNVIIHLAARVHVMNDVATEPIMEFRKVNVDSTMSLASQAADAGIKRFIFLSSIKVNGEQTAEKPFTEEDIENPQDPYAISKFEAEQKLLLLAQQTGMEVVIIRPPLVYGDGVKANFATMMRMVKRGIPLPLGAIHNKRSLVYVGNLISLILRCMHHPAAANQVFLVSDGCDLSTPELLRKCAIALGVRSKLIPIPQKLIMVCAGLFSKGQFAQRLCGNLQVNITKARILLEWSPSISVKDGLKVTAQNF